jgi:3-oxoacyl-[acyl-carrier-protein] synthase II
MGEGSGIIVLEELEHALERGAHIYAELAGYGASADASHMVQPDEEGYGAMLAFKMALDEAGIKPNQVDYINAHGTGTKLNDLVETRAIKAVFGDHSRELCISSTKPVTGHMLGAAGAVELIASVLALRIGIIPPTINLENPDPDCNLDYVPGCARKRSIQVILSDSLGFGGHNAALIARRFQS